MATKPNFTPVEAKAQFGDDLGGTIKYHGYSIVMDGPQMSPSWAWAPQATDHEGNTWYVEGEPGDPLEGRDWCGPYPV